ncbi:hypothetical protein F5B19DRAFT_478953 [Rostrohypoxylon terebratum]|nr:hypothetical protein F5B19DRAFT_478953 [Rostrohypoxylon terebratum]
MHIVQPHTIVDNPLLREPTNGMPKIEGGWLIVEYLQNGTLFNFIMKATDQDRTPKKLPNRLLWRFFLCLVKALIGLTYPLNLTGNPLVAEEIPHGFPAQSISHHDLHTANVMLGDVIMDPQHTITPALKLIDFGLAQRINPNWPKPSARDYADVAEIMISLIQMELFPLAKYIGETYWFQLDDDTQIETKAVQLVPGTPGYTNNSEWLDEDIRRLIIRMLAKDVSVQPVLRELDRVISKAVLERDQNFYDGAETESDEAVEKAWRDIVLLPNDPDPNLED